MPQFQITDSQTGRVATVEGDTAPTEQEAEQIFSSVGSNAGGGAPSSPQVSPSASPAAAPSGFEIPELKAAPERSWWDKAKTEMRERLSPIIGETDLQRLRRQADLQQLANISPTLASMVQQSVPEAKTQFQREGLGKLADVGAQAGGGIAGAELGTLTGPFAPVAVPILAGLFSMGGDYLAQRRRMSVGDQEAVKPGELAASGIIGAIPGGNLAKTGAEAIAGQAVKQALGGLGAETVRSAIDEGQLPTLKNAAWAAVLPALGGAFGEYAQQASPEISAARTAAEAKIAPKAETLAKGQAAGLVVQPSSVNPSMVNKAVESLAGGPSIRQAASRANQDVADDMARRVLNPQNPDIPLTSEIAKAVRQRAYDVGYRPVAAAGKVPVDMQYINDLQNIGASIQTAARSFPAAENQDVMNVIKSVAVGNFDAGDAIKMTQILRNRASDAFARGQNELGFANRQAAQAIEDQLERHLQGAGQPGQQMLQDFRDARTLMAQSHDIEDAIREGTGSIRPSVLASKYQAGKPLSGDLETIGAFANQFPTAMKEASRTPAPGTTVTGTFARGVLGTGLGGLVGSTTHSPEAAALAFATGAALPSIRGLVRSLVLSGPYQRLMTKIPVVVEASPDHLGLVIRQGAQAAAAGENRPDSAPAP